MPKLNLEQQEERMGWLLRTNGECPAPCVWGIIPGQTTLADARNFLMSMDKILRVPEGYPDEFQYKNMGPGGHIGGGSFTVKDGIITGIRFLVSYDIDDLERSGWAAFTPEYFFVQYGLPAQIRFWRNIQYINQSNETFDYYVSMDMILYYDSIDLIIEYRSGFTYERGDYYRYIPAYLNSPGVSISMWVGTDMFYPPPDDIGILFEDAATIDIQEFYRRIINNPGTASVDLRRDAFRRQGEAP